ncbi:MFS transporter [Aliiruegeria lutimaris]|uniref:Predicted arabinose efflux permease, MFS family n=1 Tax=Aliiruegeria lutimaris TaxID=571298 RepID=A0A1G8NC90_9RHOB|nr:MFS transporter [Aliiruegeria lutimaris]SDI77697.1 Predicted arabinose efflux permease, MFS family [Aliiruegeria lutimaris]
MQARPLGFLRENAAWLSAGFLLTLTSSFGQTFLISVFAGEIRSAFSLSHGDWGAIYALGTLASAVTMLWVGPLTDRFRARDLALIVLPILAAACLAMAAIPTAWALPFVIYALRLSGQGMTFHIAIVAMGRWFDANRGKALAVATLGVTIGQALLPLGFVALLPVFGWRALWVVAGLLVLAVVPVLTGLLRRERTPSESAHSQSSTGMEGRHWHRNEMLRHWLFWAMVPLLLGPSAFITALFFFQVHVADIKGFSHLSFVALFPVFTGCATVMMLASGIALDRLGTARLLPFLALPMALGFLVLGLGNGLAGAALGMALVGMTTGASATLVSAFWAEFYGTRNLGAIKSVAAAIMVLGSAIGPVVSGYLIDTGLGFEKQMVLIAGYFIVTAIIVTLAMRGARNTLPPAGKVDVIGA